MIRYLTVFFPLVSEIGLMLSTAVPSSAAGSDEADGFLGLVTAIVKYRDLKDFAQAAPGPISTINTKPSMGLGIFLI